jgi:hypothetical protein
MISKKKKTNGTTILERGLPPHICHSRHGFGLFFTRLDCHSNAKPSEKDHGP